MMPADESAVFAAADRKNSSTSPSPPSTRARKVDTRRRRREFTRRRSSQAKRPRESCSKSNWKIFHASGGQMIPVDDANDGDDSSLSCEKDSPTHQTGEKEKGGAKREEGAYKKMLRAVFLLKCCLTCTSRSSSLSRGDICRSNLATLKPRSFSPAWKERTPPFTFGGGVLPWRGCGSGVFRR